MKKISLTQGKVALVDDEDFEKLNRYKWFATGDGRYANRAISRNKKLKIHRMILNAPKGMDVDHINGNGLDNRKKNIRLCTRSQNRMNTGKRKDNHSGFKGVCNYRKKWRAQIQIKGKKIYLGVFKTKELAYKVYCEACVKYHGEFSHI